MTGAFDVSEAGIVVGGSVTSTTSWAYRYDVATGVLTPIEPLPGDASAVAFGIDEHGTIVGFSGPPTAPRAFTAWRHADPDHTDNQQRSVVS